MYAFGLESALSHLTSLCQPAKWRDFGHSFALSGSNQAREGRLVNA